MISESSMPSSKYKRLLPVLIAATPTPKVMKMKYLPSRVSLRRRGGRQRLQKLGRLVSVFERALTGSASER
jgi:hypothetical protein